MLYDMTIVIAGHKENFEIRFNPEQMVDQHRTTHTGHHYICKYKIGAASEMLEGFDRVVRTAGCNHLIALVGEDGLDKTQNVRFIVDNDHSPRRRLRIVGWGHPNQI